MVCFAGTGSECYIESSSAGSYTIFINTPPYSVATQQVTTPYEISDAATDVPIVLRGDGIACKAIPNGDESIHFLNTADANLISTYTSARGSTLLKTTVPGIAYTVELICDTCPEVVDLRIPPAGDDNFTPNSDIWWVWGEQMKNGSYVFAFSILRSLNLKMVLPVERYYREKLLPGILVSTPNHGSTFTLMQIHLNLPWINLHVVPLLWIQPAKISAVIK